ncbi:MAG: hypothetical protein COB36_11355 [Alphaproteobacteria bacterium]|nr:MAG: hypothetical protein COB36_11355 [Alphaproteobacteria bacterium]
MVELDSESIGVRTLRGEASPGYYGWKVLLASVVGMMFSPGPLVFGSMGVLAASLQTDFGWGISEIMLALTIQTFAAVLAAPFTGRLIDRKGVKIVLLASVVIHAALWMLIPLFMTDIWQFYGLIFLAGLLTVGMQSIAYVRTLSAWFDTHRGLSIGIAASGMGLGYMVMPVITHFAVTYGGWQAGFYCLGAILMVVSLPILILVMRNEPGDQDIEDTSGTESNASGRAIGLTTKQAVRSGVFWLIAGAIMVFSFILTGLLPNIVPILTSRGITSGEAVMAASVMGLATFVGRITVGYLIDRYFAPRIAIFFFGISTLGLFILITADNGAVVLLAMSMLGLGFGAESDLVGYLVSRYFGLKSFGEIYGYILAAFLVGAGAGPYLIGASYDLWGSFQPALMSLSVLSIFGCFLFAFMKPYPNFDNQD